MGLMGILSSCFSEKRHTESRKQGYENFKEVRATSIEEGRILSQSQNGYVEKPASGNHNTVSCHSLSQEQRTSPQNGNIEQNRYPSTEAAALSGDNLVKEEASPVEKCEVVTKHKVESNTQPTAARSEGGIIHHSQSLDSIATEKKAKRDTGAVKKSESLDYLALQKRSEVKVTSKTKLPPPKHPNSISGLLGIRGTTKSSASKMTRSASAEPLSSNSNKTTSRRRSSSGSRNTFLEALRSRTSSSSSGDLHCTALLSMIDEAKYGQRTLEEVMDAMYDLTEELPDHAVRVVYDYLSRKDIVKQLVHFVTMDEERTAVEGDSMTNLTERDYLETDARRKSRYPYVASEILAYGPKKPRRTLVEDHEALDNLFSYLESPPPLNLITAGRFAKVLAAMVQDKPTSIVRYLEKKPHNISLIVKHVGTDSIAELLVRLVAEVNDGDSKQLYFEFINHEAARLLAKVNLFKLLADAFHESCKTGKMSAYDEEVVANVCVTILGITIRVMMTTTPSIFSTDRTLNQSIKYANAVNIFNEPDVIGVLLDDSINAVYNGDDLGIALCSSLRLVRDLYRALMRGKDSPMEEVRLPINSLNTTRFETMLRKRFPMLRSILLKLPNDNVDRLFYFQTSLPRLGRLRLRIAEFFVDILCGSRPETVRAIIVNNIHRTIGEMFISYEHNSLLHSLVADGAEVFLLQRSDAESERVLFADFLMQLVLDCWKKLDKDPRDVPQTLHLGYLGAVLKISQVLDTFHRKIAVETENAEAFGKLYKDNILEMVKSQQGVLGGVEPPRHSSAWAQDRFSSRVLEAAPHESIGEALRVRLGLERRRKSGGQAEQGFFNVTRIPF
ncbi:hypothetical protein GpartN1_g4849.t1 [Galdieria partita]|uniref:Uncharacterized protein n=1 Tax=Galdieria partita TaxID=83374 RepID=A0A9C7URL4_9RHOD|nr:hypothetical protein GpartN1_g4849.t1 [Galdieria partita]